MAGVDGGLNELNELLWALPVTLDAGSVVSAVMEQGTRLFRSPLAGMWRDGELVGAYGLTDKKAEQLWAGLALAGAEPVNLYDDALNAVGAFGKRRLGALMAAPLVAPAGHLGWLVFARLDPEPYSPMEAQLLGIIASRVAGAIDNARLYAEAAQRAMELSLLAEVTEQLVSTVELQELLDAIVLRVAETFNLTQASIQLVDPETGTLPAVAAFHRDPERRRPLSDWLKANPLRRDAGLTGIAFRAKHPYLSRELANDASATAGLRELLGPGSALIIPLIVRGEPIGAMYWFKGGRHAPLNEALIPLAAQLAGQIAMAVENARLHAALQERADALARRLGDAPI